jgi:hypothetical protein
MYAAHRAAGGMTSIYRQIGVGCEHLFRQIVHDTCKYADSSFASWSYEAKTSSGKSKSLSLDARIEFSQISDPTVKKNAISWSKEYTSEIGATAFPSRGIVFEVRQGYKSKDSKRQNADIDNTTVAWASSYFPVFAIFSGQIDVDLVLRYRNNRCGILVGTLEKDSKSSIFAFCGQVLGFDLAGFFNRNSPLIKLEIMKVLRSLLTVE